MSEPEKHAIGVLVALAIPVLLAVLNGLIGGVPR